jgi:hypothetical protein
MEALSSSEMSVLTKAKWRNIPEDAILHSPKDRCNTKQQNDTMSIPVLDGEVSTSDFIICERSL